MQCQSAVCWNSARRSWRNHDYSYSYHSTLTFQFGNTDSMNVPVNLRIISNVGYITPSLRLTISPSDAYTPNGTKACSKWARPQRCVCVGDALPPSRAYTSRPANECTGTIPLWPMSLCLISVWPWNYAIVSQYNCVQIFHLNTPFSDYSKRNA